MNIVFMGTPAYATAILRRLVAEFSVSALVTMPDKLVGRKQILTPPDIKKWALESGAKFEILQPKTLKNDEIQNQIRALNPDFIVVAAYGKILPREILDIAPCINLHASILPKFRGASPIQSAILRGEALSGITAMKMSEGLDCGEKLGFSVMEISNLTSSEVFEKFGEMAANLIVKILKNYDQIAQIPQFDCDASKCAKISKNDGLVSFEASASEIVRKFRAFHPWPGIFLENGIKLTEIFHFSDKTANLGQISHIGEDFFAIGCKFGQIGIKKLQIPGKKEIAARDFLNGKRLKIGDGIS